MMRLKQTTPTGGDGTAYFEVTGFPVTVKLFFDEILKRDSEWGDVEIKDDGSTQTLEYRYGKLTDEIPDNLNDRKILKVSSVGGWTWMRYIIELQPISKKKKDKTTEESGETVRIPFDIKYRPEIESGEYVLETRNGRPARIVCWDATLKTPILAIINNGKPDGSDNNFNTNFYNNTGKFFGRMTTDSDADLFLVKNKNKIFRYIIKREDDGKYCFNIKSPWYFTEDINKAYLFKTDGIATGLAAILLANQVGKNIRVIKIEFKVE